MGGIRQLDKLIRKNVLLKARHPKRAICELALPMVLFTILALVRREYESQIWYAGPKRFDRQPIFPQARVLADIFEGTATNETFQDAESGVGSLLRRELLCHQSYSDWVGDQLEPLLSLNVSLGVPGNRTLADEVLQLDAVRASEMVHGLVRFAQEADLRDLASLAEQVGSDAKYAEAELAALWSELHEEGTGDSHMRRVRGVLDDVCRLHNPMIAWNSTNLGQGLARVWLAVQRSGLGSLLNDARKLVESTSLHHGSLQHMSWSERTVEEIGATKQTRASDGRSLRSVPSSMRATRLQELIWWASHFTTPGSLMSEALQLGNELVSLGSSLSAEPAGNLLPEENTSSSASKVKGTIHEAQGGLLRDYVTAWLPELEPGMASAFDALESLRGLNATLIERDVLPAWKESWRKHCQKLNESKIVDFVLQAQQLCPACLPKLHHAAQSLGWHAHGWQRGFSQLDSSHLKDALRRIILHTQEANSAEEQARGNPRLLARQLAGALRQELLGESSLALCGGESEGGSGKNKAGKLPLGELMRRKLLIAPYSGEVQELWDLVMVEFVLSLTSTENAEEPSFQETLLNSPLTQGMLAKGVEAIVKARTLTFATEWELEKFALDHPRDVLAALVFRSADEATGNFPAERLDVRYTVRFHAQLMPSTARIIAKTGVASKSRQYLDIGFVYLQETIGRATARLRAKREATAASSSDSEISRNMWAHNATSLIRRLSVSAEQFPSPKVKVDEFMKSVHHVLPLFAVTGWIFCVCWFAKQIVYEKQERLREVMRIHGLRTWVYWASWAAFAMAQLTVVVSVIVLILCTSHVLQHSNPVVIFMFLLVYSGAVVSFIMLISACFSNAKMAAVYAGIIYYSAYLPYVALTRYQETTSLAMKCASCLLCPTAVGSGMSLIAKWELLGEGVQWSNLGLPPPEEGRDDDFSVAHVLVMLAVDMLVYQVLAWYIEKVRPGRFGLAQPWYFPVVPSYWCRSVSTATAQPLPDGPRSEEMENPRLQCYEAAPPDLAVSVQIRRLTKTFPGGRRALKGISLEMHEGTITGLLGHNGAGKSTTMSILTGLFPPSEGDVLVNGCSVTNDPRSARRQLGVCLQQDALYDSLTVEEHLDLFCSLKSVPRNRVSAEVDALLRDTGLEAKRGALACTLSGGTRRKLSIGNALAGGSRAVALDEPTAGVDATSRRDIWRLLAAQKQHRAILLSTHFLDEADMLSDRIAIIAEGRLTAIGSSISLKKCFADRYLLTVVASHLTDPSELLAVVRSSVPEAMYAGARGREFGFALPNCARHRFAALLSSLEDDELRERVDVETYGISAATMEEVFLMASSVHEEGLHGVVRNGAEVDSNAACEDGSSTTTCDSGPLHTANDVERQEATQKGSKEDPTAMSSSTGNSISGNSSNADSSFETERVSEVADSVDCGPLLTGTPLLAQQFKARLWTRAKSASRDRRAWVSQILMPLCFVLMAMVIGAMLESGEEEPALKLTTNMFIGTVSSNRTPLDQHQIPFENIRHDPLGAWVEAAFEAAKGARDVMLPSNGGGLENGENGTQALWHYIMDHSTELRSRSYGAISMGGQGETADVTLWYNNHGVHSIPAMVHMLNLARFKVLGYGDTLTEAWSQPLPETQRLVESQPMGRGKVFASLIVAITVLLAMGFIPASFLVYLVNEKATKTKHQQLLLGVSPVTYWLSSYCWDIFNCCIPVAFVFLLFTAFQLHAYSGRNAMAILMLLLSYSGAMTPQMYCLEPVFPVPSTAYVTCIVLNIFTGTVSILTTTLLDLCASQLPHLQPMNTVLKAVFPWLLPNYSLGQGLMEVAKNQYIRFAAEEFGTCMQSDPGACSRDSLDWNVAGRYVFDMLVMSGVWFALRLLIEWRCFLRLFPRVSQEAGMKSGEEDDSVLEESARVNRIIQDWSSRGSAKGRLLVHNLSKNFERVHWRGCRRLREVVHSVKGVSMAVEGGECFGLLGVNGAGKTTTMRMITGDIEVGGGDVLLSGWSVRSRLDQARRHLGYCPQFDALADKLTVRESIHLYARIRGVAASSTKALVDGMVSRMCLEAHQHRLCEHLSGGNKRKLSTALALIGEPSVVLLDEPSTGVDVGARRFLWDVLGNARQQGLALVLTSHSMEECEVLCTRLTVMVSGEMRCLGSPLQLKARYGGGYTLALKLHRAREDKDHVQDFLKENLPMARPSEESVGLLRFQLGGSTCRGTADSQHEREEFQLAKAFGALEGALEARGPLEGKILDYTLSQTTLEEVFLHFSKPHPPEANCRYEEPCEVGSLSP